MNEFICTIKAKRSGCLDAVFRGKAVPCGSSCFQDNTGSYFLGKMSIEGIKEIESLIKDRSHAKHRALLMALLIYCKGRAE